MSKLAEIYKQAHDAVLKKYEEEPEDAWKINAIFRSRLGEKGHESTMFQFVQAVEAKVDELILSAPIMNNHVSPNKSLIEVAPTVKPTTPH